MTRKQLADNDLLLPSEVARLYGVNSKTVSRWEKDGRLAAVRTAGGHRRFRWSHVVRVLGDPREPVTADDSLGS